MKVAIILKIVGVLYNNGFRELLVRWIKDPNNKWDDNLIAGLDSFFGYTSKG